MPLIFISFSTSERTYMGGCQNYGPFLGTLNIRCRIMIGIQKETIILTTTHIMEPTGNKRSLLVTNPLNTQWKPCFIIDITRGRPI